MATLYENPAAVNTHDVGVAAHRTDESSGFVSKVQVHAAFQSKIKASNSSTAQLDEKQ
jgi:hypothetical protein